MDLFVIAHRHLWFGPTLAAPEIVRKHAWMHNYFLHALFMKLFSNYYVWGPCLAYGHVLVSIAFRSRKMKKLLYPEDTKLRNVNKTDL